RDRADDGRLDGGGEPDQPQGGARPRDGPRARPGRAQRPQSATQGRRPEGGASGRPCRGAAALRPEPRRRRDRAVDRPAAELQPARPEILSAASAARARRSILLVPVSGNSASNHTRRGCCTGASFARAKDLTSSSVAAAPGCSTTKATGTCPRSSSATGTTLAWWIAG